MPRGPYPYYWPGAGWTQVYFTDDLMSPRYHSHGQHSLRLNVSFGDDSKCNLPDSATCVPVDIFQENFDPEKTKLFLPKTPTGHKTLTLKTAKEIIRNEASNWVLYEKSREAILERRGQSLPKSVREGAAAVLQLSGPQVARHNTRGSFKTKEEADSCTTPEKKVADLKKTAKKVGLTPKKKQSHQKGPSGKVTPKGPNKRKAEKSRKESRKKKTKGQIVKLQVKVDEEQAQHLFNHSERLAKILSAETYLRNTRAFYGQDSEKAAKIVMEWLDDSLLQDFVQDAIQLMSPKQRFSLAGKYLHHAIRKVATARAQTYKLLAACEEAGKKSSEVVLGHIDAGTSGSGTSGSEMAVDSPPKVGSADAQDVDPPEVAPKTPEKPEAQEAVVNLVSPAPSDTGADESDAEDFPNRGYITSTRAKSGYAGVSYEQNRGTHPWRVKFNGGTIGRCKTKQEACELYLEAYNHHSQPKI